MSLDLLSTRAGTSPQDAACAQLLAAVIAEAIIDASEPLRAEERQAARNLNPRAVQALRYLFGPVDAPEGGANPFSAHARLIGSSAAVLRQRLLLPYAGTDLREFPDHRRRNLRARYDLSEWFVRGVEETTTCTR